MSQASLEPGTPAPAVKAARRVDGQTTTSVQAKIRALPQIGVRTLVAVGLIAAAHSYLLWLHLNYLWQKPQYGFALLVPIGAVVIAQQRLASAGPLHAGHLVPFLILMTVGVLNDLLSILLLDPPRAVQGLLFEILALAYAWGGRRLVWVLLPAWLFSWLMIPLPLGWDNTLVADLQHVTAGWSSRLLDQFRIIHLLIGNTIELPGKRLLVEEACSGVSSLFACVAGTAFFVLWAQRGVIRSMLLLVSSVGWVLVANALRVFIVAATASEGYNFAEGMPHWMLGMAVFGFTMLMVWSTDRLLEFFTLHDPRFWWNSRRPSKGPAVFPPLRSTRLNSRATWGVAAVFGSLMLWQVYLLLPIGKAAASIDLSEPPKAFGHLSAQSLPPIWGTRPQTEFKTRVDQVFESVHSRYWKYGRGSDSLNASLDFPFAEWHDIRHCYRGLGWSVSQTNVHSARFENDIPFVDCELDQKPLGFGYLVFTMFDERGKPFLPNQQSIVARLRGELTDKVANLKENWRGTGVQLVGGYGGRYIQAQVFLTSAMPITNSERDEAREMMQQLCRIVRSQMTAPAESDGE